MIFKLKGFFNAIGNFLTDYYNRPPACCASGGLSRDQLEGRRPSADPARNPLN